MGHKSNRCKVKNDRGAVLLNVLFFAIFFAVLISKIFSSLHETKASSPKVAGAQIERYVSEAVMTDVLNKCNQIRGTSLQYDFNTPNTVFGNCVIKGTVDPWDDNKIIECTKAYTDSEAVPVKLETFKGSTATRNFEATAVVTLEDINKTSGSYQWDCGGVEINNNVQG